MSNQTPTVDDIQAKVSQSAFGRPLITNVLRGHVVEAIVALALEPEWSWCAEDYSSWDFERADGFRLEVKQSAARQSWATSDKPSACSFDIAERKGRWEGQVWIEEPGRAAQVYVFAHHPVASSEADHRDASQWIFYVVAARDLPSSRRLSLSAARALTSACSFGALGEKVRSVAAKLLNDGLSAPQPPTVKL